MKEIEAENSGKRLNDRSGRKTALKKLKVSNAPESSTIKVTGHSSVAGLQSYNDSENEQDFHQISSAMGLQTVGSSRMGNLPTTFDVSADHSKVSSSGGNVFYNCITL